MKPDLKIDFKLEFGSITSITWQIENTTPSLWNVENGIPDQPLSISLGFTYRS